MVQATQTESRQHIEERYPRPASLRDGHEVTLRLMRPGDSSMIVDFARSLPAADLLFLRRDVTQEAAVAEWIREIEVGSTYTVLGFDGDELLGEGDLHYSAADWTRHLGEIRLLLSPKARGRGLGRILAEEIYAIAQLLQLQLLTARMVLDQAAAQTVFRRLGFQREAVLWDYVIDADGKTHDLLIATRRLQNPR